MEYLKEAFECTVQELDKELVARGAQRPQEELFRFDDPGESPQRDEIIAKVKGFYGEKARTIKPDPALSHISTEEIVKVLLFKTGRIELGGVRGTWGKDDRMDPCDINDDNVVHNANAVAAVVSTSCLVDSGNGSAELRVKNYGKTYNLCGCEPFHYQPVCNGIMRSAFLVRDDIVATGAHCVDRGLANLRFVFGYKMADPHQPVTEIPMDNIYKAAEIVGTKYTSRMAVDGTDYALVKLDRKVKDQTVTELSSSGISENKPVYVIGHPAGLPLKFAPGAKIMEIKNTYFTADLDIYSGNSGSPVFDAEDHTVVGIVVQGDIYDFRDTGKCVVSVVYPNPDPEFKSRGTRCTRLTEFSRHLT